MTIEDRRDVINRIYAREDTKGKLDQAFDEVIALLDELVSLENDRDQWKARARALERRAEIRYGT